MENFHDEPCCAGVEAAGGLIEHEDPGRRGRVGDGVGYLCGVGDKAPEWHNGSWDYCERIIEGIASHESCVLQKVLLGTRLVLLYLLV